MDNELIFSIIDKYFGDNPYSLVSHHLDSFNDFISKDLKEIFKLNNPITILKNQNKTTNEFELECNLYLGGKNGDKIYYGKPIIYDDNRTQYMLPNEARLRNMTYGFTIHYDMEVEFKIVENEEIIEQNITLEKIYLGRFPIMLQSNLCLLNNFNNEIKFNAGECRNDPGGYFIIDGKEKVIVCQEKFADNMLYIRDNYSDIYKYSIEIKSASDDPSKPIRTTAIRLVTPSTTMSNNNLVVVIPNIRKPIPLFIVMRALGIISDKEIITYCLLDLEKNNKYIDLFIPSIHDTGKIFNQESAIKYIATFTKGKTSAHVLDILSNYFLPHIGELNFKNKALFLGYMAFKILKASTKEEKVTDRDNFKYKRVESSGILLTSLFKEYYAIYKQTIFQKIDKEYYYHEGQYQGLQFMNLIENNYKEIFKERIVESGFNKAFKGNWGAATHTKRPGVVQDLNRLSFNSAMAQRRKLNLQMDDSAKVIGPRLLHSSQWGMVDPLDTPDGGNVGLHKHMTMVSKITTGYSRLKLLYLLKNTTYISFINEFNNVEGLKNLIKIFINGCWVGVTNEPIKLTKLLISYRRIALIPVYTSISWDIREANIYIYTDKGRLCRPIFYIDENREISCLNKIIYDKIKTDKFRWEELITGFNKKNDYNINNNKIYSINDLYGDDNELNTLLKKQACIEYIDCSESEGAYISSEITDFTKTDHTHMDIHPSLLLGVMGNQIIYPENNQLPRNLFSCGQSKQAVSLYHSNFRNRIDKMGLILNYGQVPLVQSRYMKYINNNQHPYGENVIVAIMCYGGYNVEDSILFNEGSIDRGLFRTTYYNSYETYEESSKVGNNMVDSKFTNIESENVVGVKPGVDYSTLDSNGLIKENTELNDKIALIGKTLLNLDDPNSKIDASIYPKKGQLGFVDKAFMTEGSEGFRIAKVRIREERIPDIGDKFCSRCGQKGTVGQIIPEKDMPFTQNGIRPDIIINPHAFPSRMTIGQLVEVLTGKCAVHYGAFGDCTAFLNKGPKNTIYEKMLSEIGYNKTGNELLYNGETGEQLESDIYIGPTYYMRLKHMVKDKINYRARGPRTMLTRQTVQGRANDGGLRIGEMERDGIIGHGASRFLQDSLMNRGDEYEMAICNNSGTIAIYNESKNIFISPMADGPIKFNGEIEDKLSIINVSKYGRDFSVVKIPYSFKLLMQELITMNVQMRIITEQNVDQLTSMSYSNNINILLNNKDITVKDYTKQHKSKQSNEQYSKNQYDSPPDYKEEPIKTPKQYYNYDPKDPTFVGDVIYEIGEPVHLNIDNNTERIWSIITIDSDTGDYTLMTNALDNLPEFALLSDTGNSASLIAKKLQIFKVIKKPISYEYAPFGQTTPNYGPPQSNESYNPESPNYGPPQSNEPYNPESPEYNPYGQASPNYGPPQSNEPYNPESPEYNPYGQASQNYGPPNSTPPVTFPPATNIQPQTQPMTEPQTPEGSGVLEDVSTSILDTVEDKSKTTEKDDNKNTKTININNI